MKLRSKLYCLTAIMGIGLIAATAYSGGVKSRAAKESLPQPAAANPGKLIVHEWGTFTSFSGSNGVQLDFRPLINEELPNFVMDRLLQSGTPIFTKARVRARIRMETPVTYFYTDHERTVRASVEFPEGLLTEFYPPVVAMAPEFKLGREPLGKSKLDWGEITLIPTANLAPQVKDEKTRKWMQHLIEQRIVPHDGSSNHYYHARETDSALVHVRHTPDTQRLGNTAGDFLEKFLFYRGVGRFEQPISAVIAEDGQVKVTNSGQQPIRSLFQVTVSGKNLKFTQLNKLDAGATATFSKTADPVALDVLEKEIVKALIAEQLYPREAEAMVRTWATSWFAEEGTRIFYMVPREITDKVLPLTISPAPDESVRVLVGRVEVMPPSVERKLMEIVRTNASRRKELQDNQIDGVGDKTDLPIPEELRKLGRLAEPALVRIRELAPDHFTSQEAEVLLRECQAALDAVAVSEARK